MRLGSTRSTTRIATPGGSSSIGTKSDQAARSPASLHRWEGVKIHLRSLDIPLALGPRRVRGADLRSAFANEFAPTGRGIAGGGLDAPSPWSGALLNLSTNGGLASRNPLGNEPKPKKRFFTEFRGEATHIGLARLCEEVWLTACSRMQPSPPPLSRRRARGDSRRHRPNIPEAQTGLKLRENGGARTAPLQEAERNRCRGGRAAWMPREACGAMDGPSRRAPGATM
ncbi:hypothetical protein D3C84_269950 [compost metagenome]